MNNRPLILVSLLLAAFAINLDTTIVNVAPPLSSYGNSTQRTASCNGSSKTIPRLRGAPRSLRGACRTGSGARGCSSRVSRLLGLSSALGGLAAELGAANRRKVLYGPRRGDGVPLDALADIQRLDFARSDLLRRAVELERVRELRQLLLRRRWRGPEPVPQLAPGADRQLEPVSATPLRSAPTA